MTEKAISSELSKINKRIDSLSDAVSVRKKSYSGYMILVLAVAVFLGAAFLLGPGITGFVTFSESVFKTESGSFTVGSDDIVSISTDLEDINSVMLSGVVYGKGKASVFIEGTDKDYLAYYFEGDAKEGFNFTDMCYDTCHIDGLGNRNRLKFYLDGTRMRIDGIKYLYSKIIDFSLEPARTEIMYETDPAKVIDITLTNKELKDFTVLLYVEGPLSSSFGWQGSLIHMTQDVPKKTVSIAVKLPSNLAKGSYVHRVVARYVPPGEYEFVGESPIAESYVVVVNG